MKKQAIWKWGKQEQSVFENLKQCLMTPLALKQANGTKSFVLRIDASNDAWCCIFTGY